MSKILVIDDEIPVRANLVELLEAEEFDVISAEDGRAGVQLARQQLPDLIICDITMPELDGYGVLAELRQDPATATLPFIFLTARADRTDLRQGMNLGADDYVVKPFTRDELLRAISARLAKQAAHNQKLDAKLGNLRSSITLALPHELRTPLTSIIGYSALLSDECDTLAIQDIREMAQGIHSSAERLHDLILNFVLYAELEIAIRDPVYARAIKDEGPCSVQSSVTEAALRQAQEAHREADLTVDIEAAAVQVGATFVAKMAKELVRNAFKFSKAGTPVSVTGRRDGNTYALSILDHGRGMTAEQIADVGAYLQFERRRHEQQGSGLGLTIAKRLAELHGGALDIESQYGQNTVVHVVLPVRSDVGPVADKL